jgi:NAD(P)H-binding
LDKRAGEYLLKMGAAAFGARTEFMKVIVTGANGAVGQSVLRCGAEFTDEPITFIALARSDKAAETLKPLLRSSDRVTRVSYMATKDLAAALGDGKALIHLSGILVESATSTYEEAHVTATRSIVEAAKQSVIEKLILVSAVGTDEKSTNGYWRTKGQAEAIIRSSGVAFTILRVPLLLGRGTEGAAALKRNASSQKPKLIGGGRRKGGDPCLSPFRSTKSHAQTCWPCFTFGTGPCGACRESSRSRCPRFVGSKRPDAVCAANWQADRKTRIFGRCT